MKNKKQKTINHCKHVLYHSLYRVLLWIEIHKDKFAVGDIVNLTHINGCRASYKDGTLKRFKVVYIDDIGMPYVRQIAKKRGYKKGSTSSAFTLTNFGECSPQHINFYMNNTEYGSKLIKGMELDEGYINSVMLGERFDPRAEYKARRGIIAPI